MIGYLAGHGLDVFPHSRREMKVASLDATSLKDNANCRLEASLKSDTMCAGAHAGPTSRIPMTFSRALYERPISFDLQPLESCLTSHFFLIEMSNNTSISDQFDHPNVSY